MEQSIRCGGAEGTELGVEGWETLPSDQRERLVERLRYWLALVRRVASPCTDNCAGSGQAKRTKTHPPVPSILIKSTRDCSKQQTTRIMSSSQSPTCTAQQWPHRRPPWTRCDASRGGTTMCLSAMAADPATRSLSWTISPRTRPHTPHPHIHGCLSMDGPFSINKSDTGTTSSGGSSIAGASTTSTPSMSVMPTHTRSSGSQDMEGTRTLPSLKQTRYT